MFSIFFFSGVSLADPVISATNTDALSTDADNDTKADPGDVIQYTISIMNSGTTAATGLKLSEIPDANTDDVSGSLKISPISVDDVYSGIPGNIVFSQDAEGGVLVNDIDPDGILTDSVTPETKATDQGGHVTLFSDGRFEYEPPAGFVGNDAFTYSITDSDGIPANEPGRVTLTVSNPVWFVDSSFSGTTGDGSQRTPFTTLAAAELASGNNDFIFVYKGVSGSTDTMYSGIALKEGQKLFGERYGLTVNGQEIVPADEAGQPQITSTTGAVLTLAGNNEIRGVGIVISAGTIHGIYGEDLTDPVIFDQVEISDMVGTIGTGITLTGGTGNLTFTDSTLIFSETSGRVLNFEGTNGVFNLAGIEITGDASKGIRINNNSGTCNFGTVNLYATSGHAIEISNSTGNIGFTDGIIDGSTGSGLYLENNSGTVDPGGLIFTDNADSQIRITGGSMTFTCPEDLATSSGRHLYISGTTGGSITFSGTHTIMGGSGILLENNRGDISFSNSVELGDAVNRLTSDALVLTGNTGTIAFSSALNIFTDGGRGIVSDSGTLNVTSGTVDTLGKLALDLAGTTLGMRLDRVKVDGSWEGGVKLSGNQGSIDFIQVDLTTTGGTAFLAENSGTITVFDASGLLKSVISANGGPGLVIDGTTIGSNGVWFARVGVSNAANGILLNSTGSSGGFSLTGNGSSGSGGTIQNTTAAPVLLTDTHDVLLQYLDVTGNENQNAVEATRVENLTFHGFSATAGSGNARAFEGSQITNLMIQGQSVFDGGGGAVPNIDAVRITDLWGRCEFSDAVFRNGKDMNLVIENTSVKEGASDTLTIKNHTVFSDSAGGDHLQITSRGAASMKVIIEADVSFSGVAQDALQAACEGTSALDISVTGCTFSGNTGSAVNMAAAQSGKLTASLTNMTMGSQGASVVNVMGYDSSEITADIAGNTINSNAVGNGICVVHEGDAGGWIHARIANNRVDLTNGAARDGIRIDAGMNPDDACTVCLNMNQNSSTTNGRDRVGYRLDRKTGSTFQLQNYNPGDLVSQWISVTNSNTGTTQAGFPDGFTDGSCD